MNLIIIVFYWFSSSAVYSFKFLYLFLEDGPLNGLMLGAFVEVTLNTDLHTILYVPSGINENEHFLNSYEHHKSDHKKWNY